MAVWTCAVTRALGGKQFFRCRPLVLAFHTYLTRYLATRKFYPCGRILLWGTGSGECRCGLLRRVESIVTTCSRFWSRFWLLPSLVATLQRTSFLYLDCGHFKLRFL